MQMWRVYCMYFIRKQVNRIVNDSYELTGTDEYFYKFRSVKEHRNFEFPEPSCPQTPYVCVVRHNFVPMTLRRRLRWPYFTCS
jgi:hypothetical protein